MADSERKVQHVFFKKHFSRPVYCNDCLNLLWGLGKQGLSCEKCGCIVHEKCAASLKLDCVDHYRPGQKFGEIHHWVPGNLAFRKSCSICSKGYEVTGSFDGAACSKCGITAHLECQPSVPQICTPAHTSLLLLSPEKSSENDQSNTTEIGKRKRGEEKVQSKKVPLVPKADKINVKEFSMPLIAFVNSRSGGGQGVTVLRGLRRLLNAKQVVDLSDGGPDPALKRMNGEKFAVLACGGDGTVGWLLSRIFALKIQPQPPVGVLALGTGNDMSRTLGFGGGYVGAPLREELSKIMRSSIVPLDRWSVTMQHTDEVLPEGMDRVRTEGMNLYFSLGIDAQVAHNFHLQRERNPHLFKSRTGNKAWYGIFGAAQTFSKTIILHELITLFQVDDQEIEIPSSIQGIAILNVDSYGAGKDLWDNGKPSLPPFTTPSSGDGKVEIVGFRNAIHLAAIQSGAESGIRIAQGSKIILQTTEPLAVQVDGEPWNMPAAKVALNFHSKAPMFALRS